jgi:biotin carboxyl carrier protein
MDIEAVEQIVALLKEFPVAEITLEQEGRRVHVRRPAPVAKGPGPNEGPPAAPEASLAAAGVPAESEPVLLTSPMVGLFHHLVPPAGYGGLIAPGDVVGSIESMKLMSDVVADQGGRVVEVLIEDGAPVEYGQALFRLSPG